jgi:glycosyltransferase involved in cell wall biosynthesis
VDASVIIPARNAADIQRLSDALDAQTIARARFEVVVVDDASTPAIDYCGSGPARVVRLDRHAGSYAARNAGIRAAVGRALAFTDADCVPDPEWLEAGLRALETSPRAAGRILVTTGSEPNLWERLDRARFLRQERYVEEGFGATANLFMRREVIDAVGPFDERLPSGGDAEHGQRARAFPIVLAADAMVRHAARSTARALLGKAHRVGLGLGCQVRLHGLGGLFDRASDRLRVGSRTGDSLAVSLGLLAVHGATALGVVRGLLDDEPIGAGGPSPR